MHDDTRVDSILNYFELVRGLHRQGLPRRRGAGPGFDGGRRLVAPRRAHSGLGVLFRAWELVGARGLKPAITSSSSRSPASASSSRCASRSRRRPSSRPAAHDAPVVPSFRRTRHRPRGPGGRSRPGCRVGELRDDLWTRVGAGLVDRGDDAASVGPRSTQPQRPVVPVLAGAALRPSGTPWRGASPRTPSPGTRSASPGACMVSRCRFRSPGCRAART